jgi:RHS repeat-associated protein
MDAWQRLRLCAIPAIAASLLAAAGGVAFGAPPDDGSHPATPARQVPAVKNVHGLAARFSAAATSPKAYRPTHTSWPESASAEFALAPPAAGAARGPRLTAGKTPVWAQAVTAKGPAKLSVKVLDHAAAQAAAVPGVLLTVDADRSGPARIGVDYGGFADAYGGNYAAGLALATYPACVLTTPAQAACRKSTPLSSSNDMDARTVSATVPAVRGTVVLAVAATSTGSSGGAPAGTYNATSLSPSGSWVGGGSTGNFHYAYPITLPDGPSSMAPDMSLIYDSATSDGRTAATDAQSSWAGEGWNTPESYVEQSFQSCSESPEGSAAPSTVYDQCYDGPIYTLSLNGSTQSLVWDDAKKVFRTETADGTTIVHYCTLPAGKTSFTDPTCTAGSSNASGTYFNDWWKIVSRTGTAYSFGMNRLPGWTSGKTATGSVAWEPVYSAHSGDPCYNATFSAAVCTMGYRWGLDYAVDVHGNAMAYYYHTDTNSYGAFNTTTAKSYVRDMYLTTIDYGFADGGAYGTVPNKLVFGTGPRCVSGTCAPLSATTAPNWPDVPFTRVCAATPCTEHAPAFYSTVRLTSIQTQQYSLSAAKYDPIDTYALTQSMPQAGDGNVSTLWLDQVVRTAAAQGGAGPGASTPAITFPPVKFGATAPMANRLDTQTDGLPAYFRYRLGKITTETGSNITIQYFLPNPCSASAKPAAASNTLSCFPVSWTPDGYTAPITDWFNKYAVQQVNQDDPTGHASAQVTSYAYNGGAAWHYDDNELVKAKYRTYGQFRGYGTVTTYLGDGVTDAKTKATTTYYRGMSKNNNSTVLNVTDSLSGAHEDVDKLAGRELENSSYLGADVEHSTITSYWVSDAAASRSRTGLPALTSTWIAPVEEFSRQAVTSTGATTWRYTQTDTSYVSTPTDSGFGLPVRVFTHTSPIDPAYSVCTTNTYAPVNTAKNLVGLIAESETDSVACGGYTEGSKPSVPGSVNTLTAPATVSRPAQVVSDTRTFYDDTSFATTFPQPAAPSKPDVTMVRKAVDYTGGGYTWQTDTRAKYDTVGRTTDGYDGNGADTKTAYTTNSLGLVTGMTVTNALNQSTSTTRDVQRGRTLSSTDPNGVVTTGRYDAAGRVASVWLFSRAISTPANYVFVYALSNTGPTAVTTQKLNDELGYQVSTQIYDGLLRVRQTQTGTPAGGRLITDAFYDSRGWVSASYTDWWDSKATPDTTTVTAADLAAQVPMQNVYTRDSLGRVVIDKNQNNGVPVSTSTTVYNGDRTTTIPPDGGNVATTVTDPIGRTTEIDSYLTRPALHAPANPFTGVFTVSGGSTQPVLYGYDGHGNRSTVRQGAAGPVWSRTYDLLGRATTITDPDTGTAKNIKYDGAGNLTESTDARGKVTSYAYDALSRKLGAYNSAVTAQSTANQSAAWVYDNANGVAGVTHAIGRLTTSTAYVDANAYTTQQTDFNIFGESLGTSVTIPSTEGALANTYLVKHTYTDTTGLPLRDIYPAKGGLPAEQVLHTYRSAFDLPDSLAGLAGYTQTTSYDALSNVNQTKFGPSITAFDVVDNVYDPNSQRLTSSLLSRTTDGGTTVTQVDQQAYRYDQAGNVLGQTSSRNGAVAETQCFSYDGLTQLTGAWTANDNCATQPSAANSGMVADSLGSSSAYWTTWSFDNLGDRVEQIQHAFAGGPAADSTTGYGYGAAGNQPHTLTSTTTTGAASATTSYGYDVAGNMTSRNAGQGNQTISYDDAGKLTGITGSTGGSSTFAYDANGTLLLQRDPGSTTLYLGDQQFTLNTATGAVSGNRYYALPGGGRAIRTGTAATSFTYELTDQHNTPTIYLDSQGASPRWRQYTPYGGERGSAVAKPDNRGFLNKATDVNTGLTIVGARQYDPATGRFITADPILELGDPTQLNGYGYASNNPVVHSDPTGERTDDQYFGPVGAANIEKNAVAYANSPDVQRSDKTHGGGGKGTGTGLVAVSPHVYVHANDPALNRWRSAYAHAQKHYHWWENNWTHSKEANIWERICLSPGMGCPKGFIDLVLGHDGSYDNGFDKAVTDPDSQHRKLSLVLGAVPTPGESGSGGVFRSLRQPETMVGASKEELRAMVPEEWVEEPLKKGTGIRLGSPAKGKRPFGSRGWAEFNEGVPTSQDPLHNEPFIRLSAGGLRYRAAAEGSSVIGSDGELDIISTGDPGPGLEGARDIGEPPIVE